MTYEQSILRLEEIISALNSESVSLDESLTLFSEGAKTIANCDKMLKQAEVKIETLSEMGENNE